MAFTCAEKRYRAFAKQYVLNGGNGTKAAKAAGSRAQSDAAAAVTATRWLKKDKVKRYIAMEEMKLNDDPRYSPEALAAWLLRLGEKAEERGELSVAGTQAMNIAKLAGHLVDQVKVIKDAETESLMTRLREIAPEVLENGA